MSTKKSQQSEITQSQLVRVARQLFAERGYSDIGTDEIVRAAEVTRGALYHHYRKKEDLFVAVVEQVMRDMHESLLAAVVTSKGDMWLALELGIEAFLDVSMREDVLRIAFRDAPSVLGWQRWRELDAKYGLGLLEQALGGAIEAGVIARQPVKPLAHLLLGALTEAAMMIGNAEQPKQARASLEGALKHLLLGLRAGATDLPSERAANAASTRKQSSRETRRGGGAVSR